MADIKQQAELFREFCRQHGITSHLDAVERLKDDLIDLLQGEFEDEWEDIARILISDQAPEAALSDLKAERRRYERELRSLQMELIKLQDWVVGTGRRVVVLFEGRDAAGKGGAIKTITARLNPRVVQVVALPKPTAEERTQWYFQRYVRHLPSAGQIVLFDRSWYNRAGVERVMGFASETEVEHFFRSVPEFEKMLVGSGIDLVKYWFSVSDQEQEFRFLARIHDPLKQWKLSPMDLQSRIRWEDYTRAKEKMLRRTSTEAAPWSVVPGDNKRKARLNCIADLLSRFDYFEVERDEIRLPERKHDEAYRRNPVPESMLVPERF